MTPGQVDELDDLMFMALVRHMQREAEAIEKTNATTKLPMS